MWAIGLILLVVYCEATLPVCKTCPEGGQWSTWTPKAACSGTCGLKGKQTQTRTCSSASSGCPCTGVSTRTIWCAPKACPTTPYCGPGFSRTKTANGYVCGTQKLTTNYVAPTCQITTSTIKPPPICTNTCAQDLDKYHFLDMNGELTYTYSTSGGCSTATYTCTGNSSISTTWYFLVEYLQPHTGYYSVYHQKGPINQSNSTWLFKCSQTATGPQWTFLGYPFDQLECNSCGGVGFKCCGTDTCP